MTVESFSMSKQDIISGLKFSEDPHIQGTYLATILRNKKADVSVVAQVAIETISEAGVVHVSLVLPTLFALKKRDLDCVQVEDKVKEFCKTVNQILGIDHLRRVVLPKDLRPDADLYTREFDNFIQRGFKARGNTDEKVYFLANVVIADCKEFFASSESESRVSLLCSDNLRTVLDLAKTATYETWSGETLNLTVLLDNVLEKMTGRDSKVIKDIQKVQEILLPIQANDRNQQVPEQGWCILS